MITRQIKCPQCGAPKETLEESIMLMCDYCGSLISVETSQYFRGDGMAKLHEQAMQKLVNPTAADARKTKLTFEMQKAQEAGDRETWRMLAQEYFPLFALSDPHMIPGGGQDPDALRTWVMESMKSTELMYFDLQVKEAYDRYSKLMAGLSSSEDVVATAKEMLEAAAGYYNVMYSHPEYPRTGTPDDVQQMSKQMVRNAVTAFETMMAKGDAARIYSEVLGDKTADESGGFECENCGAPLTASELEGKRCPYCGGLIHVDEEDPWLAGLLASFRPMVKMMQNDEALAQTALNHPLAGYWTGGRLPDVADGFKFLQEAVGWLPAEVILKTAKDLKKVYADKEELKQYFRDLKGAMGQWVKRPKPEEAAAAAKAAGAGGATAAVVMQAEDESADLSKDPWVEQQVTMWEYSKPEPGAGKEEVATSLVAMALSPFQLGGAISVGQARAFFKRAAPEASSKKLVEALKMMKHAAPNEQAKQFLKDLAKKLSKHAKK